MPSSGNDKTKRDVAIYIDYENLYISLRSTVGQNPNFDVIMDKCREFGRLTVVRAYADWSEFARVVTSQMFATGVDPIYVPTRKFYDAKTRSQATKNSVDIHITIDIMKDVLQSRNIDVFVLVSGDRDFVPLMNQIRATGREVYAIGVAGCTSSELSVAVDEMFYYHQLLESEEELAAETRDIYTKLVRAIEIARGRGYRCTLGVIKPLMKELVVGFDERKFRNSKGVPFQQFKQFAKEAERQGFIRVVEHGESVELLLATEDAAQRQKELAERGTQRAPQPAQPRRHVPATAASPSAEGAEPAAEGESGGDGEEPQQASGGRRRGRRGGRGRKRRGAAASAEGTSAVEATESSETTEDAADDATDDVAADAEEEVAAAPARTAAPRGNGHGHAERPAPRAAAPRALDEDEGDADEEAALAGVEDAPLPGEAMGDLESIMKSFSGRAPSQRRLIARLKKGAADGELRGSYREGQFLLMVRKALQDGHLEKVSKGFYSGLKWNDEQAPAGF